VESVDPLAKELFPEWTSRKVDVGRLALHVVSAGSGAAVLLLHGFPEFWYSWRHQMPALLQAGYRVLVPDLPGYNFSDKPRGVSAFRGQLLVEDIAGLVRSQANGKVRVVGHDWGGALAWALAGLHPELVERLVILNAPHPNLFGKALRRPKQLARLWYMFFFQLPVLPERRMSKRSSIARALRGSAKVKGAFTDEDVARYVEAFRRPGAATASIDYYRAAFRRARQRLPRIDAPTLVLWGEDDPVLGLDLLGGLEEHVPRRRIHRVRGAGHWVQNEKPDEVTRELLRFFREDHDHAETARDRAGA
jgi:epoxide hydrolase 4